MNFGNKPIKFTDGAEFIADRDYPISLFNEKIVSRIFNMQRNEECDSIVTINGLIARYCTDEDGKELKEIHTIIPIENNYVTIQHHPKEPFYILDKNFRYLKDTTGKKLQFVYPPMYHNGVFNEYNTRNSRYMLPDGYIGKVEKAYFEDGTVVGQKDQSKIDLIQHSGAQKIAGILGVE